MNVYLGKLYMSRHIDNNQLYADWCHLQTPIRRIGKACSEFHISFDLDHYASAAQVHVDCKVDGPKSLACQLETAYFTPDLRRTLAQGSSGEDCCADEFVRLEKRVLRSLYSLWFCQQEANGGKKSYETLEKWFLMEDKEMR